MAAGEASELFGELGGSIERVRVPAEIEQEWRRFCSGSASEATKRAVFRAVVLDESWKAAAEAEGCTRQGVWKVARSYGLAAKKGGGLVRGYARIATLSQEEIERRLVEEPEGETTKDLATIAKVAGERVDAALEREQGGTAYTSLLDRLAEQLAAGGGGSFTLELKVSSGSGPETVDVTPVGEERDGISQEA